MNTCAAIETSHSGSRTCASASATVAVEPITMISGVINAPAVPGAYDNSERTTSASSSSMASRTVDRCWAGISASKSARSSNSISSSTSIRRSRSRLAIRANCSLSGNSSRRSAKRSSSISLANNWRWAWGRARTTPATSLGCMSRSRAASAAISVGAANRPFTSSQSTRR